MNIKPLVDRFWSLNKDLDAAIAAGIPECGRIDIEPEDKCVFPDKNDDRPEHRSVKAVIACPSGSGYELETEDEWGHLERVTQAEWYLSINDKYNILKAMNQA